MPMLIDHYRNVSEVAQHFRTSEWTVRNWLRTGYLPGTKIGREWRISDSDLLMFRDELRKPR